MGQGGPWFDEISGFQDSRETLAQSPFPNFLSLKENLGFLSRVPCSVSQRLFLIHKAVLCRSAVLLRAVNCG